MKKNIEEIRKNISLINDKFIKISLEDNLSNIYESYNKIIIFMEKKEIDKLIKKPSFVKRILLGEGNDKDEITNRFNEKIEEIEKNIEDIKKYRFKTKRDEILLKELKLELNEEKEKIEKILNLQNIEQYKIEENISLTKNLIEQLTISIENNLINITNSEMTINFLISDAFTLWKNNILNLILKEDKEAFEREKNKLIENIKK